MTEPQTAAQKVKRPVAITIAGWYFILQGWMAFGVDSISVAWKFALVALLICIGIGFLKQYRAAWYAAVVLYGALVSWGMYLLLAAARPSAAGTQLAAVFGGSIFLMILLTPGMRLPFFVGAGTPRKTVLKDWIPMLAGTLVLSAVAAVGAHTASRGQPRPAGDPVRWFEFSPADSSFSVRFPEQPKTGVQGVNLPVGYTELHTYIVEEESTAFGVTVTDYPGGYIAKVTVDGLLDAAQDQAAASIGGQVTHKTQTASNGYIVRRVSYSAPGARTGGSADLYVVGDRVYKVLAHYSIDSVGQDVIPAKCDTYLHSFRILGSSAETSKTAAPTAWWVFVSNEGGFKILMPNAPMTRDSNVGHTPSGGTATQYIFQVVDAGLTFAVSYGVEPDPPSDQRAAVADACDALVSSVGGKVVRKSDTTLQGYPCRDLYFESPTFGAYRVRVVQAGARLYVVMINGPKADVASRAADTFVASFSLVK
jgi:hypothetical protein